MAGLYPFYLKAAALGIVSALSPLSKGRTQSFNLQEADPRPGAWWSSTAVRLGWPGPPRGTTCPITTQDQVMARLQETGLMKRCEPRIAEPKDPEYWLARPGSPKPGLEDEEGRGYTVDYDTLIQAWREGKVGI
jgi:hypothetical protein